jgi:hypothetical protein
MLVKVLKTKTWTQVQYNTVDTTEEELQQKPLDELEKEEQKVEETLTEIIGNFQKATIIVIGDGKTALDFKVGDIVLIKYGSGEDFQWIKDTKLLQKHQAIGKIFK